MNKSELIDKLAAKMDLPTKEAATIVNTLIETMSDVLAQGRNIQIRGFGSFSVKDYGAYEGRNPNTGDKVMVEAKRLPVFKVGKDLCERVNESE